MQAADEMKTNMNGKSMPMNTKAASRIADAFGDTAHKAADAVIGFKDGVEHKYQELEDQAHALADASVDVVKRYPLYSLLGASAVGIIAGFLIAKKI